MEVQIEQSWKAYLQQEFDKPYFAKLTEFVHAGYSQFACYPPEKLIFNAFNLCPFDRMKVVIIGQGPHHEQGQAHGLGLLVNDGVPFPPSLQNIFKEIRADMEMPIPTTGNLTRWVKQGVMLFDTALTVRAHAAGNHQRRGWETFTDAVIKLLSDHRERLVFLLWGGYARSKSHLIDKRERRVLEGIHPSPLSTNRGGQLGSHRFSRRNKYLVQQGTEPMKW